MCQNDLVVRICKGDIEDVRVICVSRKGKKSSTKRKVYDLADQVAQEKTSTITRNTKDYTE